jgi:hypothetical protein
MGQSLLFLQETCWSTLEDFSSCWVLLHDQTLLKLQLAKPRKYKQHWIFMANK